MTSSSPDKPSRPRGARSPRGSNPPRSNPRSSTRGLLAGAALGLDLTGLITAAQRQLTADEAARLEDFARRRLAGEPVARILGHKEFWGLPLTLSPATLVPRPDTETVVELALELLRAGGALDRPLRIADLGTGSGAILLALLSELPNAHGIRHRHFASRLADRQHQCRACVGLSDRTTFIACDYASGLSGPFDLIVSNPPYIRSAISPTSPSRSGTTTRWRRSMAAPTGSTPTAR